MIGGGAMTREHIKAFRDVPGVEIAGICNRTREKAQALATEFGIPYVATSIADLYAKTNADLAIVAVYETAINPVMREVLAHPWAVLMEKPIGVDLADAESVAAAANNHRVFVGLNRRFLSSTQAVLTDLANDPGPRFVHVQDQQSLDVARQIGHAEAVVKNWMFANSIHLVDYLCAFGRGEVADVTPVTRWTPETPGVVLAKIAFSSRRHGSLRRNLERPGTVGLHRHDAAPPLGNASAGEGGVSERRRARAQSGRAACLGCRVQARRPAAGGARRRRRAWRAG